MKGKFLKDMMNQQGTIAPESSAVRVALWRALHVQADAPPHVLKDEIGLELVAPDSGWQQRPDMNVERTSRFRASIVARARFIEDLIEEESKKGVDQYIILGAGLDTFAQRKKGIASRMKIFEIDQAGPQAWKKKRLQELGFGIPDWLKFVPINFEKEVSWLEPLVAHGFDRPKPAIVASTGVSLYLTKEAILKTLRQVTALAPGSRLAMTFILPLELVPPEERPGFEASIKGAKASGTPFLSFFSPEEMLALGQEAGFKKVEHVSSNALTELYFAHRTDGLRPGSEELLLATV